MTLFKQLFIGTSIAFLIIFGATETIYISNAHKYLQEQLASHAQDAATSLGMVLPSAMVDGDAVKAEVTVNAVFDRGYFQSIRVLNIKGETVVLKTLSSTPIDVPEWFVNVLPLDTPHAESLITKGWHQLGRVVVSSHPNFAYKQLWRTLLEATLSLFLLYLVALFALQSYLHRILKPLRAIEEVAQSISERNFQIVRFIPRARELRSAVNAINSMSNKLRAIIENEVQQAIHFRDESSKDVLTGLENRRGFEAYVGTLVDDNKNIVSGAMYMLQIADFQAYNSRFGYQEGDNFLKKISVALKLVWKEKDILRSRVNGATFILVVPNISRNEAVQLGNDLMLALNIVIDSHLIETPVGFGCGSVFFAGQLVTLNSLLAQCDLLMQQSISFGMRDCIVQNLIEEDQGKGSQYWKKFILESIEEGRIALLSQPVINIRNNELIQIEVVGRLQQENGELILAEQFIPMAIRHGLTPSLDLAILKKLFGRMISGMITEDEVAINLSVNSIHDPVLLEWLRNAMRLSPLLPQRLVFEFTELGLVQDRNGVETFVNEMRKFGAKFAVDNFGLHQSAFEYLQKLKPRYVKLSQTYIQDLLSNHNHQFFISSVVKITRPLEIRVIALGIENISNMELLRDLGVDGYQGYVTGELTQLG